MLRRYGVFLTLSTTLGITLCEARQSYMQYTFSVSCRLPSAAQFREAAFYPTLNCITQLLVLSNHGPETGAQYVPNAPPGYHGTELYFYSRIVDIVIGAHLRAVLNEQPSTVFTIQSAHLQLERSA